MNEKPRRPRMMAVDAPTEAPVTKADIKEAVKEAFDVLAWRPVKNIVTQFRLYPPGTRIETRGLTYTEVKKLSGLLKADNPDHIINDIVGRATRGVHVSEMFNVDKIMLAFVLRANTFPDENFVVPYDCPLCKKKASYHFDLTNLNFEFLPDSYDPNKEFILDSGAVVTLKLLRTKDKLEVDAFVNTPTFKVATANGNFDEEILNVAAMIDTIDGEYMSLEDKYIFMNTPSKFSAYDGADISSYLNELNIGVQSTMKVVCTECGGSSETGLNFLPEFFIPSRKR